MMEVSVKKSASSSAERKEKRTFMSRLGLPNLPSLRGGVSSPEALRTHESEASPSEQYIARKYSNKITIVDYSSAPSAPASCCEENTHFCDPLRDWIYDHRGFFREHGDAVISSIVTAIIAVNLTLFFGRDFHVYDSWLAPKGTTDATFENGTDVLATRFLTVRELALPLPPGSQTHEIFWDVYSKTAFVTSPTASKLIQIPFNGWGEMMRTVRWWTVGHPSAPRALAGLHSVSGSGRFPGSMWISTETDNRIYLVKEANWFQSTFLWNQSGFNHLYKMEVPLAMPLGGGLFGHVGGPHSVREGPDGAVWVCLKGLNMEAPKYDEPATASDYKRQKREKFVVEGVEGLTAGDDMRYAVWKVYPDEYDEGDFPARGGVLYPAGASPTMSAFDARGNAYHSIDREASVLRVDAATGQADSISLPSLLNVSGTDYDWDFTNGNGPGVVAGPDGSVWLTNLGAKHPWLVRFLPGSDEPQVVKLSTPGDERHVIHLAFSEQGGPSGRANVMYALTSSLLAPEADETVMIQQFDASWSAPVFDGEVGYNEVQLSGDNSAAHRIVVAENLSPRCLLVTGLLSNTIYQISGTSI